MAGETRLPLDAVGEGTMKAVDLDGEEIVVAKVGGKCFAFGGICTHDGGPIAEGELDGDHVTCPWHFTEFDVTTGAVIDGLAEDPLPVYEVRVEGDEIVILKP